jgi:hypothetical protein
MASPAPQCPHGVTYAQPCYGCGWACPTCQRAYAPWVRECSYRHEDGGGAGFPLNLPPAPQRAKSATALQLALPAEMADPNYQRIANIGRNWREIFPGLQCYARNPVPGVDGTVTICMRLTPEPGSDDQP